MKHSVVNMGHGVYYYHVFYITRLNEQGPNGTRWIAESGPGDPVFYTHTLDLACVTIDSYTRPS